MWGAKASIPYGLLRLFRPCTKIPHPETLGRFNPQRAVQALSPLGIGGAGKPTVWLQSPTGKEGFFAGWFKKVWTLSLTVSIPNGQQRLFRLRPWRSSKRTIEVSIPNGLLWLFRPTLEYLAQFVLYKSQSPTGHIGSFACGLLFAKGDGKAVSIPYGTHRLFRLYMAVYLPRLES